MLHLQQDSVLTLGSRDVGQSIDRGYRELDLCGAGCRIDKFRITATCTTIVSLLKDIIGYLRFVSERSWLRLAVVNSVDWIRLHP